MGLIRIDTVALDTAAFLRLMRGDERVRSMIAEQPQAQFGIPAPVLAEIFRGGADRDVRAHKIANVHQVWQLTRAASIAAGVMLGKLESRRQPRLYADALILATARENGAQAILTEDPRDMRALLDGDRFGLFDLKTGRWA